MTKRSSTLLLLVGLASGSSLTKSPGGGDVSDGGNVAAPGDSGGTVGVLDGGATVDAAVATDSETISSDFPFESKYVEVLGAEMHYVDEGDPNGSVILLVHGNPMSAYFWRNVIPHLTPHARVVAVDLIGMGRSERPSIDYFFTDHASYFEAFIEALELRDITLVGHDWGSGLAMHYATRHQDNVRGIAVMEAVLGAVEWSRYTTEMRELLQFLRSEAGRRLIIEENVVIEPGIQDDVIRRLRPEELEAYRQPFRDPSHRALIWRWITEIPIGGEPAQMHALVNQYMGVMATWDVPKLLVYAEPGTEYPPEEAREIAATLPNCEAVSAGPGLHYLVEDQPHTIGRAISAWFEGLDR